MNRTELDVAAGLFVYNQSIELADKIGDVLSEDVASRVKQMSSPIAHYVHNLALFYALARINCLFLSNNDSDEACEEYHEHVESLKTQFLDIVDSLKDFEPSDKGKAPAD